MILGLGDHHALTGDELCRCRISSGDSHLHGLDQGASDVSHDLAPRRFLLRVQIHRLAHGLQASDVLRTQPGVTVSETGGYGGVTLNVGVVKVPDERLDTLAGIFKPKKIIHADVTYVDLPAPPPSTEGHVGTEELPADHLARLRDSDALLHVVRAFEDDNHPHPEGSVDARRDLDRLDFEFVIAHRPIVSDEPVTLPDSSAASELRKNSVPLLSSS